MKTITCKEINDYIQRKGGSVSVEELAVFLSESDKVVAGNVAPMSGFSLIDWIKEERTGNDSLVSLRESFEHFHNAYGWSYNKIKTAFVEEVKERKCDNFGLARCLSTSLDKHEKKILPIYKNSYIAYIIFR